VNKNKTSLTSRRWRCTPKYPVLPFRTKRSGERVQAFSAEAVAESLTAASLIHSTETVLLLLVCAQLSEVIDPLVPHRGSDLSVGNVGWGFDLAFCNTPRDQWPDKHRENGDYQPVAALCSAMTRSFAWKNFAPWPSSKSRSSLIAKAKSPVPRDSALTTLPRPLKKVPGRDRTIPTAITTEEPSGIRKALESKIPLLLMFSD
jgi:hypothetical protein